MPFEPLRVACIGMGWWSDVLADAITRSAKLKIVACYTRTDDKRRPPDCFGPSLRTRSRSTSAVRSPPSRRVLGAARSTDWPHGCRFRQRCPYSWELCEQEHPPLYQVGVAHVSRCHLAIEPEQ